jgi:hypothetical protein
VTLPFDSAQFFDVFRQYNTAVWPAQPVLTGLGLLAAVLAFRPRPGSDRIVAGILAALWAWMGTVYHLHFFRPINSAAVGFGALFVAQAIVFLWYGIARSRLRFHAPRSAPGILGGLVLIYAFVLYPLLARSLGHLYPASPTFGLPCPTTIATLGLLLWAVPPLTLATLVIPLVWAAVGTSAAVYLGVREDFGLGFAGLATLLAVPFVRRAPGSHSRE